VTRRFTETNTRLLLIVGPILALAAFTMVAGVGGPGPGGVTLLGSAILLLGHTLQVTLEEEAIEVWLGIGILRTRIARDDIATISVTEVRTPPWLGRGVRGSELVYAVGPRPAVRLELRDGRVLTLGLRNASELAAALRKDPAA